MDIEPDLITIRSEETQEETQESPQEPSTLDSSDEEFEAYLKGYFTFINNNFREYSSITNFTTKSTKHLTKLGYDITQDNWIMLEKIHGANFSFMVKDDMVGSCKRYGPLAI